jgi:hypothetical protein
MNKVETAMDDFEDPAYLVPKNSGSPTILYPYEFAIDEKWY